MDWKETDLGFWLLIINLSLLSEFCIIISGDDFFLGLEGHFPEEECLKEKLS